MSVPNFLDVYREARPLFEAASERLGPADAVRVVEFVITWRWLREVDGEAPRPGKTGGRHAEVLAVSQATYFRRLALFRRAFPGADDPGAVDDLAGDVAMPTLFEALRHT
jgi:hypothetical protein